MSKRESIEAMVTEKGAMAGHRVKLAVVPQVGDLINVAYVPEGSDETTDLRLEVVHVMHSLTEGARGTHEIELLVKAADPKLFQWEQSFERRAK
jgi:hypothetical protein